MNRRKIVINTESNMITNAKPFINKLNISDISQFSKYCDRGEISEQNMNGKCNIDIVTGTEFNKSWCIYGVMEESLSYTFTFTFKKVWFDHQSAVCLQL
jgi:hypothetical protein